jgi:hypothetical protein
VPREPWGELPSWDGWSEELALRLVASAFHEEGPGLLCGDALSVAGGDLHPDAVVAKITSGLLDQLSKREFWM